ncbi:hypothetical protein [Microbacterium arborescens]|uniref:hypothetical protein n=1 Tax=Microbacterium arborescens TaxID=33883 RepID=UPI00277F791C|nr:hypothetical protein [Microbacterium arborescens]MDQ1217180.1 hypothetical protein [Microbacterium arborescens]
MTNNEVSPDEQLYTAMMGIPGWYEALQNGQEFPAAQYGVGAGRIVSSILLAAGDDAEPIAVAGKLQEDRTGWLVVVYASLIVSVDVTQLNNDGFEYATDVHFPRDLSDLSVISGHSYYNGINGRPRHRGMQFTFTLAGKPVHMFSAHHYNNSSLITDDAIYAAYVSLRDSAAGMTSRR